MNEKIYEIKQKIIKLKPILKEKYKIKEIGIFGSYIKGKQTKRSDLDILVEFEEVPDFLLILKLKNSSPQRINSIRIFVSNF